MSKATSPADLAIGLFFPCPPGSSRGSGHRRLGREAQRSARRMLFCANALRQMIPVAPRDGICSE